jgi:hypothetical protein
VTPRRLREARWKRYDYPPTYRNKHNFSVALQEKAPNYSGFPRHISRAQLVNLRPTRWRKRQMEAMRHVVERNNRLIRMVRTMRKRVA